MLLNRSTASHPTTAARAALRTTDTGIEETEGKKKKKKSIAQRTAASAILSRGKGGGEPRYSNSLSTTRMSLASVHLGTSLCVCVCFRGQKKKKALAVTRVGALTFVCQVRRERRKRGMKNNNAAEANTFDVAAAAASRR